MSSAAYRCNPTGAEHVPTCRCFDLSPALSQSDRYIAGVDATVPHGPFTVAAAWTPHTTRSAEHLLFGAEGCVPYNEAEVPVILPALFPSGGATWNGHHVEVLYDDHHLPALIPAEVDVDENFFSLLLSQVPTLYAIHGPERLVFGYGDYRPHFTYPDKPIGGYPRMSNVPNVACLFQHGRFTPSVFSIVGNWWCVSDCMKYVCVRAASAEEAGRCFVVLTAYQFLVLFVPWWRGGPLYVGEPDCHRIPAHNRVIMGLNDGNPDFNVNGYPQVTGELVGARDDIGALPVYDFGYKRQGAFPTSRSKWICWANKSTPAAYGALYTGFKRSTPPPTRRFGDKFPAEVARYILQIIASDGERVTGKEDLIIKGVKTFPLECGCSTFYTCSSPTPAEREWLGHLKIPLLFTERVHHAGHGEEDWTPCDMPYVYHAFPAMIKCVHEISVKTLPPTCGTIIKEWGGLLCPQVEYGSRILKFTNALRRDLAHSHYAWEEMHYPWDTAYEVIADVGTVVSGIGLATYTEYEWSYPAKSRAMVDSWDYPLKTYDALKSVVCHNQYYQWKVEEGGNVARPNLPASVPPVREVTIGDVVNWRNTSEQLWVREYIRYKDPTASFGYEEHWVSDEDASDASEDSDETGPENDDLIQAFIQDEDED